MSATDNDLQVFTTERKVALATAADAKRRRAFGDAFTHRSRPHISAALPVHTIISSPRRTAGGKGRAAGLLPANNSQQLHVEPDTDVDAEFLNSDGDEDSVSADGDRDSDDD